MDGKGLLKMRYASVAVTIAIVIMLILSGPATAIQIGLNIDNTTPVQGEKVTFTVTTDISGMDKYVPMENFSLLLYNDDKVVRNIVFALNGTIISGGQGVTIDPIAVPSSSDYGYGYGYGYDYGYGYGYNFGYGYGYAANKGVGGSTLIYMYNVSLDTINFDVGEYGARVILNTGNNAKPDFSSTLIKFSIVPKDPANNPAEKLKDLQDYILSLEGVNTGTKTSLAANLNNAIIMIEREDKEKSIQRLEKVIGSIQEQHLPRNRLSSEQAEYIVGELESIIELIQKGEE
jgi:translation elongation factor EF-1beta